MSLKIIDDKYVIMESRSKTVLCVASSIIIIGSVCYWLKHKNLKKSKKK